MDLLNAAVSAAVVTLVGLLLSFQLRGLVRALRREMDQFRREVREDIRDVRGEIRDVRTDIAAVRADLTQVALAVGARPASGRHRN